MQDGHKILIADSDSAAAMRQASAFLRLGWQVVSASDAIRAQNLARKETPAAIVLSSLLPGGAATVTVKRFRSSAHTVVLPVVVVAKPGGPTKEDILAAGATDFIEKPEDIAAICDSVRRHLGTEPIRVQAPQDILGSPLRMAALATADVLDTAPSRLQDSITRIAAELLAVPVTLLSIVDHDRQFFKSQVGLPNPWAADRQTPLSHSFCQWVVSSEDELVVRDAREQSALKSNLAIRELGVISYAGIPVHSQQGPVLGSFCAIDSKPHDWTHSEMANLRNLARMSEAALVVEGRAFNGPARSRGMATIALNATRIVRRQPDAVGTARSLLLELLEDQTRDLLRSMPE